MHWLMLMVHVPGRCPRPKWGRKSLNRVGRNPYFVQLIDFYRNLHGKSPVSVLSMHQQLSHNVTQTVIFLLHLSCHEQQTLLSSLHLRTGCQHPFLAKYVPERESSSIRATWPGNCGDHVSRRRVRMLRTVGGLSGETWIPGGKSESSRSSGGEE